jgi:hypothetical protein
MHRRLFFDPYYDSWSVRENSAVLGTVAGCSSQNGLVLRPDRERRDLSSRSFLF